MKFQFVPISGNRKTGPIPVTNSDATICKVTAHLMVLVLGINNRRFLC